MRILSSIVWGIAGLLAGGGGAAMLSGLSFMMTGIAVCFEIQRESWCVSDQSESAAISEGAADPASRRA